MTMSSQSGEIHSKEMRIGWLADDLDDIARVVIEFLLQGFKGLSCGFSLCQCLTPALDHLLV
jgi:hypothetical protein